MRNSTVLMVAFGVLGLIDLSILCAQNPLRSQEQPIRIVEGSENQSMLNRLLDSPVDSGGSDQVSSVAGQFDAYNQDVESGIPKRHIDSNVVPASFSPIPKKNDATGNQIEHVEGSVGEEVSFIDRERASEDGNKQTKESAGPNLGQLLSKIGMNLAFVLSLAIGFVLLAKQWMKPKKAAPTSAADSESLHVKEVLVLDSKTTLRLVQWRTNRILVATDAEGIKSVNVLNPSFDQTLDELSREPVMAEESPAPMLSEGTEPRIAEPRIVEPTQIDERLLRKLLQNAGSKKVGKTTLPQRGAA